MRPANGKHNRARERLQQKAAANRAARLPQSTAISEKTTSQEVLSGGAFKPYLPRRRSQQEFTAIQRAAYYVGSFPVPPSGEDISKLVDKKIRTLTVKKDAPGTPVKVVVLRDGIKVFHVDGETPFMAHALMRISLSMGFRATQLFAFVARNPSTRGGETLCHVLYCTKEDVPDELSNLVSRAFELAYVDVLSSKSQLAHAPTAIAKSKLNTQVSSESLSLAKSPASPTTPNIPEELGSVDLEEQKRLLELYSKGRGLKRPEKKPAPKPPNQRTGADIQRQRREEQQEKMMKRLELLRQRDELLELKRKQQEAKEASAVPTMTSTTRDQHPSNNQHTLGGTKVLKKRVVHRKPGDGSSPQLSRAGIAQGSSSPAASPLSSLGTQSSYDTVSHAANNVLPLPPRSAKPQEKTAQAGGTEGSLEHSRKRHEEPTKGEFLPGGGFLPDKARRKDPPKVPVNSATYDEVSASEELVALARMARETMRKPPVTVDINAADPLGEDGYVKPADARQGAPALPPKAEQSSYDMAQSYRHDNSAAAVPNLAVVDSTKMSIPRRVKRVSAQDYRSSSIEEANTPPAPQQNSAKAAARMSASEPLQFLQNARAGLGIDASTSSHEQKPTSPVSSMNPNEFLENTAVSLLEANEKEISEIFGEEFDNVDLIQQRELLEQFARNHKREEELSDDDEDSPLTAELNDSVSLSDDEMNPRHAQWFQSEIPRHVAMQILETQPAGAFIVRDSSSHKNCFALSLNTGDDIGHFLIERGEDDDTLHFSGQAQCFADLGSLISFHCHTPGPLPLVLSIVKMNPYVRGDEDLIYDAVDGDDYFNLPDADDMVLL